MQKVQVTIYIPDGWELACQEARQANPGEYYWHPGWTHPCIRGDSMPTTTGYFILRPKWVWPSWIKGKCLIKDMYGAWYVCADIPKVGGEFWVGCGRTTQISPEFFDFTPPECADWRQSLTLNPNWQGECNEQQEEC